MTNLQRSFLIIGIVALVTLIVFVTILRGMLSRNKVSSLNPTPVPTSSIERGETRVLSTQEKRKIAEDLNSDYFSFSQEQNNKLKELCNYRSVDFDISCSSMLNQNFVSKKNAKSEEEFKKLLEDRGLLELYENNPSLFIITDADVNTASGQAEERFLELIDEEKEEAEEVQKVAPETSKDLQLLVDLMKTLLSFDLGTTEQVGGGATQEPSSIEGIIYPPNLGRPTSAGYYQMPNPQNNEYVFSSSACPPQRFGSRTLTGVLYTVALAWKEKYPNSRLRIGDLNATGHITHSEGVDVDITVSDGSSARIGAPTEKIIDLGKMFIDTGTIEVIIFASTSGNSQGVAVRSALQSYANSKGLSFRTYAYPSHDDHFHVRIYPKYRLPYFKPGC